MASKRPAVQLRRGFKTEAEAIAREIRTELHLTSIAPLDVRALAAHLEIPTIPISEYAKEHPGLVRFFRGKGLSVFSATTVFITATERVIVYNDFHALTRQASDITHECGHGLLLHEPALRSPQADAVTSTTNRSTRRRGSGASCSFRTMRRCTS